ncbi:MAG: hypothetical protein KIH08_05460 [Candidatus Freyarchaeota archaeon]|nr:hypothetical protein [Candidatus Jordarchaeia archaeon]MBS7267625.1 hypothetical protein [Candidatus Jordarchaeia archaeon]MBS7279235.1 hypothetical protein [Candidatus Jordarchaeia archaeon]
MEIFPPIRDEVTSRMAELNKQLNKKKEKNPFLVMQKMMEVTMEVTKKFEPQIKKKTGMTAEEFLKYQKEHKEEIKAYLEEHPDLKEKMEKLKVKINISES